MSTVKVAVCIKDMDAREFVIKKGSAFYVKEIVRVKKYAPEQPDYLILEGYWKGGTDNIERISTYGNGDYREHFRVADVDKPCVICKYQHYDYDTGEPECTAGYCVRPDAFSNDDEEDDDEEEDV